MPSGRPGEGIELDPEDLPELLAMKNSPERRFRERANIVLQYAVTPNRKAVAKTLLLDPAVVSKWLTRYRKKGMLGLRAKSIGRPRVLTDQDVSELLNDRHYVGPNVKPTNLTQSLKHG